MNFFLKIIYSNSYTKNNYSNSIFNLFNNKDYYTSSYHNWKDEFYERSVLHIQMGSLQMKFTSTQLNTYMSMIILVMMTHTLH